MLRTGRVLVVGANGQLGGELVSALVARGVEPVTACRGPVDGALVMDLAEPSVAARQVEARAPAVVFNAAAYTAVDRAETEPTLAHRINAQAPGALAAACRACGALMVHFSTDYVFDGNSERAYRESDRAQPVNEYGRSKLEGELAVSASGAAHLIVRTSGLYTPGGSNFVATMLRLFRTPGPLGVVDDQRSSPTCARSLAAALVARLDETTAADLARLSGVYHLCAAGEASWYEFARAIHERAQPRPAATLGAISSEDFGAPARRPRRSTLDCSLARERLGLALPHWRRQLDGVMPEFNRLAVPDAR